MNDVTKEKEQAFHEALKQHFIAEAKGRDLEGSALDPDGEFAFTIVAFCKPKDAKAWCEADGEGPSSRADRATAVATSMLQSCPDLEADDEGNFTTESIIREGMHTLCSSVLTRFLSEVALVQVVGTAKGVLGRREETLNA